MKSTPYLLGLIAIFSLTSCISNPVSDYLNSRWDNNCPRPTEDQLDNKHLKIQEGITKKCQIRKYLSNFDYAEVMNAQGEKMLVIKANDSLLLFTFDEQETLTHYQRRTD